MDGGQAAAPPVVMVTGGLSGIGAASALAFARLGARLMLCDRADAGAQLLVHRVREAGGDALVRTLDVRDAEALAAAADAAVAAFGGLDVLVASAGIADQSDVATGDPERWREVVDTNLLGTVYATRAAVPAMLARGGGHVFVVASISGREVYPGEPVYIATKWGQVGFAHALRQDLMDANVRVSVIEPGIVDTPLTRDNPRVRPLLDASRPLSAADVAAALVYAWQQPPHVVVSEVALRPQQQRLPDLR